MEPARLRQQRHPPSTPGCRRVTESTPEPVVPHERSPADAGLDEPESTCTQHSRLPLRHIDVERRGRLAQPGPHDGETAADIVAGLIPTGAAPGRAAARGRTVV